MNIGFRPQSISLSDSVLTKKLPVGKLYCFSWWLPETDTYLDSGPTMMVPRYNAATYYDPQSGVRTYLQIILLLKRYSVNINRFHFLYSSCG
jgi:hypothetical protein